MQNACPCKAAVGSSWRFVQCYCTAEPSDLIFSILQKDATRASEANCLERECSSKSPFPTLRLAVPKRIVIIQIQVGVIVVIKKFSPTKPKIEGAGLNSDCISSNVFSLGFEIKCLLYRYQTKAYGPSRRESPAGLVQACIGETLCAGIWK